MVQVIVEGRTFPVKSGSNSSSETVGCWHSEPVIPDLWLS